MCTQDYIMYSCGCAQKGEFRQCDDKYDSQSNLQCSVTNRHDKRSRNYCPKHLIKETKDAKLYTESN